MTLADDIRKDQERPQVKLMSMAEWTVKTDEPAPGWVKVVGPCLPVQAPTLAADLNGEDYIARHAEARRIARLPAIEQAYLDALDALEKADELEDAATVEFAARSKWEDLPVDRGGAHGPKGKALSAWQLARAELHVAKTAFRTARGKLK